MRLTSLLALSALTAAALPACGSSVAPSNPDASTPGPLPGDGSTPRGSAGCGKAIAPGFVSSLSIDVAGKKRSYALTVPSGYDPTRAYPLIFAFHGDGGTGAGLRGGLKLEAAASDQAIFVYPDGNNTTWDLDTAPEKNADAAFFDALVTTHLDILCIDRERIFATGFSRGGYFANQLGCWRGDTLRGVASNGSGGPYGKNYDETGHLICPVKGMATIVFHGTGDSPSEGQKSVDHWAWANGCPSARSQSPVSPSPCKSVDGCAEGKPVVWCLIPGLGHQIWSQSDETTWAFFSKL